VVRRARGGGERNLAAEIGVEALGERRARMSAVEMVGGVAPFYRVREAIG
jgi:hypothetical protein